MATKTKGLSRAEKRRREIIWYLFIALFSILFLIALKIAFETSTAAPREAPPSVVRIDHDAAPPPPLSESAQFQKGVSLLGSASAVERRQGMEILMAANPAAATPYILERLGDPDPTLRAAAATLLATYRIPDADVPLVSLLMDPDAGVRSAVARALLGYASQPRILNALASPLGSTDPGIVETALTVWRACAAHDKPAALQAIRPALANPNDGIRARVLGELIAVYRPSELEAIRSDLERLQASTQEQTTDEAFSP